MIDHHLSAQENLATIKQEIVAIPARHEFSSYLEYLCNKKIGEFTEVEIKRAAENFLPTIERIASHHNTAEKLRQAFSFAQFNTGAAILGFCAVASEFVKDVRRLSKQDYWAIWFCIEILQHSAVNDIALKSNLVRTEHKDVQCFFVPTGQVITFRTLPTSLGSKPYQQSLGIVELRNVERQKTESI